MSADSARGIVLLRELAARHQMMLDKAEALQWNELLGDEAIAEDLLGKLRQTDLGAMSEAERQQARQLLADILATDRLLVERVKPWMDQVRPLLDSFAGRRETP